MRREYRSALPKIIYSFIGAQLDSASNRRGKDKHRIARKWRPTVSLAHVSGVVKIRLLHDDQAALAEDVRTDLLTINPGLTVTVTELAFDDPWDPAKTYATMRDFFDGVFESPDPAHLYLIHDNTGTSCQCVCAYRLVDRGVFDGCLIHSIPGPPGTPGSHRIIDLSLPEYQAVSDSAQAQAHSHQDELKRGIATRSASFNSMIAEIEIVARQSRDPILLMGPTGAGKSHLATQITQLKKTLGQLDGEYVEVNCATLVGDGAMSALFGHTKGAYTGAGAAREGLLASANGGMLFLDEIGELGLEEQAMLLSAIETGWYRPMGSDKPMQSSFQLIAGTNRDLLAASDAGQFRADLLARIDLWTFELPSLRERKEDIEPNLEYELAVCKHSDGTVGVVMNADAKQRYLRFAKSEDGVWKHNFRDLNGSVRRMATLSGNGVIDRDNVEREIVRLKRSWGHSGGTEAPGCVPADVWARIDDLQRPAILRAIEVIAQSEYYSEASAKLMDKSRLQIANPNDSSRLRTWLAKFGIEMKAIPLRGKV